MSVYICLKNRRTPSAEIPVLEVISYSEWVKSSSASIHWHPRSVLWVRFHHLLAVGLKGWDALDGRPFRTVLLVHSSLTIPFVQCTDEPPSADPSQFTATASFSKPLPSFPPKLQITHKAFNFDKISTHGLYTDHWIIRPLVSLISFQSSGLLIVISCWCHLS